MRGCPQGWVEFTWKYPKPNGKHQSIDVVTPKGTIRCTKKGVWGKKTVFLGHETKQKYLRVVMNQLEKKDLGKYKCEVQPDLFHYTEEVELAFGKRHSLFI